AIVALAGKLPGDAAQEARRVLWAAASREERPAQLRACCAEALAELDVLTTPLSILRGELARHVTDIPHGGAKRLASTEVCEAADSDLARVLSVLSRDDFSLGIDRMPAFVTLYRGEPRRFTFWRVLFELMHPAPSKRQAFRHTVARK